MNLFYVVPIYLTGTGLLYIFAVISFGQVIDKSKDGQVATYYKFGSKRFGYRTFGLVRNVDLFQDSSRYYWLRVKTGEGNTLMLEKHPTLRTANERLDELRQRLI